MILFIYYYYFFWICHFCSRKITLSALKWKCTRTRKVMSYDYPLIYNLLQVSICNKKWIMRLIIVNLLYLFDFSKYIPFEIHKCFVRKDPTFFFVCLFDNSIINGGEIWILNVFVRNLERCQLSYKALDKKSKVCTLTFSSYLT